MAESKYNAYSDINEIPEGHPQGVYALRWHPLYPKDNLHLGNGMKLKVKAVGPRNKPYPVDFRATKEMVDSLLPLETVELRPGNILKNAERYWPERKDQALKRKRKAAGRQGGLAKAAKAKAEAAQAVKEGDDVTEANPE